MNQIEIDVFLKFVRDVMEKEPSLLPETIGVATAGVKAFAENQSDRSTKLAYKLFMVLESIPVPTDGKFGPFSVKEVVEELDGCFRGTPGLKRLKEKFGVEQQITIDNL